MALANPEKKKVAVPISASSEVDIIAHEFGIDVVKTRDSHLALMEAASDKEMSFVGGTKGGFIFNKFLFASDGMYSVAKLLEYMARTKKTLGQLNQETPRLTMVKEKVNCAWHFKGQVMRKLMKETEKNDRVLIDGIKLYFPKLAAFTTVMLFPDRTRPYFHIQAESSEPEVAKHLCNEYEIKIKTWTGRE